MKTHFEAASKRKLIIQLTSGIGLGLLLTSMLIAMATNGTFSRMTAEAEETCSTVAWYAQGGYWRDDVRNYLTQAEFVLVPNSEAGARLEFDDEDLNEGN